METCVQSLELIDSTGRIESQCMLPSRNSNELSIRVKSTPISCSLTLTDDRLDLWQQVGGVYNIGIFHWWPTEPAKKLAREWKYMLVADDKIWDQNGFNDLVQTQVGAAVNDESGLVYAYEKLGLLFDRLWFPYPRVLLGSMTRQPFICPLDHVFERDDLEEGEIAMSGDVHVNLQQSGSLNHDHDENKDEHVLLMITEN
ncbi:arabinosyltransferase XEG113 [Tanacetum coccineum]